MHVLVLGSGVIGTSLAYYLARAGHQVTVVDRQSGPALETSFANAGQVSPGYSAPWAGPGIPAKALKWMLMEHSPLVLKPHKDPAMARWLVKMLGNCNEISYRRNKGRMLRLAEYSRDCLRSLRAETGIRYDERSRGTLQVFRSQAQLDSIAQDTAILDDFGVAYEVLDRAGYLAHEPALAGVQDKFVGALRLPGDETGDCFKFTRALAGMAEALGVHFRFGEQVQALETAGGVLTGVRTRAGLLQADRYVVALGSFSPALLAPLGLKIPVYPVKGYSITVPVANPDQAPVSTVMDETHKVAVTRLGERIRVGGTAQLSGFDPSLVESRRRTLEFVLTDLFPDGANLAQVEFWTGLRPMTPDGTPILGETPVGKLYVCTGHGTLGWTMAAGSGRVMADVISGRTPEIDMEGLGLSRYV